MLVAANMTGHRNDGKDKYRRRIITRAEVFEVILQYSLDHKGNSPSIRNLHKRLRGLGYDISRTAVQTHVERLQWRDKKLMRDADGELVIIGSEWNPPD